MKTTANLPPVLRRSEGGHAMIAAMMLLLIVISLAGLTISRTSATARFGARATSYARTERISDGLIEYAYGIWKSTVVQKDAAVTATELAALNLSATAPTFSGVGNVTGAALSIQPANEYGVPVTTPPRLRTFLPDYPGWVGFTYNYVASVRLNATTGLNKSSAATAGSKRVFQYTQVPMFQAMYFFEDNLEIYRPAPMIVGGLVHSNSRLLLSGSSDQSGVEINFQGNLSYAGGSNTTPGFSVTEAPIGGLAWSGKTLAEMEAPTFSNGGQSEQVSKVSRYEPLGSKPASVINATDTNLNNDSFRELIELPVTTAGMTDPPEIAKRRLFNKAGIVMEINGTTVTVTTKNGTATPTPTQLTNLKAAFTGKSSFWDQREGYKVDAANIDMSKVTPVVNGLAGFNGVLYIYDSTALVTGDMEVKTIRLQKGGVLPDGGLTIASQNPVYVQGDYNTGTTTSPTAVPANSTGNPSNTDSPVVAGYTRKPAAVIADAVMLLSNSWDDANSQSSATSTSGRVASNSTYNMAILAGFIPSGWDPDGSGPQAAYGYSGGANNFPRFMEAWSGKSCTYYGSMVELFRSQVFTGKWNTGSIYSAPNRRWNFDTLFSDTPPPGSVDAVALSRGSWTRL